MYMCVLRFACIEFSYCKSRSTLLKAIKSDVVNVGDRQTPDAVWSQNSDVIRDIVSPGHISAKMD